MDRRRSLISFIRQIPDEIWLQIIRCANPSGHGVDISFPEILTPRALAQTCSRLRNLVCQSPTIWSTIFIDLSFLQESHAPLLQWILNITRNTPLTLRIDRSDEMAVHVSDVSPPLRRVLAQALAQTEDLHVDYDLIMHINFEVDLPCPELQRLSISYVHRPSPPPTHYSYRQLHALLHAPQLAHLTLDDLSWLAGDPIIPQTGLRSLHCGIRPEETTLSALSEQFPSLRSLNILTSHATSGEHLQDVTFAYLQKLTVTWDDSSGSPILDYITAPLLLDLELGFSWSSSGPSSIVSFFQRSACPLQILRIHIPLALAWEVGDGWHSLLVVLPTLQQLHLRVTPSSEDGLSLCQLLTLRPMHPVTLPNLTELHVEIQKREWDQDSHTDVVRCVEALLTLSESRCSRSTFIPTPLRYLTLVTTLIPNPWGVAPYPPPNHTYPPVIHERIQLLMESGIECTTHLDFT
ncbi:hypothetical protein AAF712_006685 [Marasmius tenuissimus]|uniref:F-box domain-containing protein n=1 Tax=Marasmius tenuissimus TaxID=585030 RepID=A0ABR2ZYW7_9AGAR